MVRIIITLLLLSFPLLFGQEKNSPIFIEHNSIIAESDQSEIISYRIPYNNLLFVKNGDYYSSSFTVTFEFYKNDEFVFREISPKLTSNNYNETLSNKKFIQDFVKLKIDPGKYKLKTLLGLGATEIEYKIPDIKIIVDSLSNTSLQKPIILSSSNDKDKTSFVLSNYGNLIPYSHQKFDILFGNSNSSTETANVSIIQNKKVIFSKDINPLIKGGIQIKKIKDRILLSANNLASNNYFLISDFSHLLYEGVSELIIKLDSLEKKYTLTTKWIDKPKILNNPEYSIKLLGYIEKDIIIGDLLSLSENNYSTALTEHWIEKYPANGMKFNFAMEEYYNRADYSIKNFSSLNSIDGAERDRGKIYILYGEPTSIERNYTEMNEIVEVWKYSNSGLSFVFKDDSGTGKFDIMK